MSAHLIPDGMDILIVDDQEPVRTVLSRILEAGGYPCRTAASVSEARIALAERPPALLLCDIDMPRESGLVLVEELRSAAPQVAVLMVTALDDPAVADIALDGGAFGYIVKPFERNEIVINVAAALRRRAAAIETDLTRGHLEQLVQARTEALDASLGELREVASHLDHWHEETLLRLACAAEFRDPETANHLERMSRYCYALARAAGLPDERCELIRLASPMHDVGKIGIPDAVLLKPGPFDDADREAMALHPRLGHRLLAGSGSELLDLAAVVALTHHERVDGTGYPDGLRGDEIPIEGRIVAIADVFDALTSERRYKRAFTIDEAFATMLEERGTHFDSELLDVFRALRGELEAIRDEWAEHGEG